MTGWADTWMMSSHAKHPNCMYKWMAWMITPEVAGRRSAEYFGEAPANPLACRPGPRLRRRTASRTSAPSTTRTTSVLQRDRLLEDPQCELRRQPRPDLRRLLASGSRPGHEITGLSRRDRGAAAGPVAAGAVDDDGSPPQPADPRGGSRRPLPHPARLGPPRPPLGWFGLVYLGSLAPPARLRVLVPRPDDPGIVHQLSLDNFQKLVGEPRLPDHRPADGGRGRARHRWRTSCSPSRSRTSWRASRRRARGRSWWSPSCCRCGRATSSGSTPGG